MRVRITDVVAHSSEAVDGPAVNVLTDASNKVWWASAGEDAVIVLQMEKVQKWWS